MINKRFLFLFLFLSSFTFLAQDGIEKKPLKEILKGLEEKHLVRFAYSDELIKNISLIAPKKSLSFDQILNYLNQDTYLNFKSFDKRFVTVSLVNKTITICGKILDINNYNPLSQASIKIDSLNRGAFSDKYGNFTLQNIPVNSTVTISYIGYTKMVFNAVDFFIKIPCKKIYLSEKVEELNEVSINKLLTTGFLKNIDGSTVLNPNKFGILPGLTEPDVLKAIKVLPGIESANESVANINVRGGTHDQNLIIWDGIKMYHSGHFFGLISSYNPYITKKVTVVKNGTSSKYTNGVSSTINMETNDVVKSVFSGGFGFNLLSTDLFLNTPITNDFSLQFSARRSLTDFLSTPTFTNYFSRSFQENSISSNTSNNKNSNFHFYDYTLKALYDINYNHQLRVNLIGIENKLNYQEKYTSNENTIVEDSNLKQKSIAGSIKLKSEWTPNFSSTLAAFYSNYQVKSLDYNKDSDQLQTQLNDVLETQFMFNTTYHFTKNIYVTNGFVFNETGIRNKTTVNAPTYKKNEKNVLITNSLFSEIEYKKNTTYIRFGSRANYYHKFNTLVFEPRINFRQQVSQKYSIKIKSEIKHQATSQKFDFQDNFLGIEKRRWVLSDNNKTPILKSKQISIGTEYSHNKLFIDVTGFYKQVQNISAANLSFYNNTQTFNMIGDFNSKGIEFLINKKTSKISSWLSYTFSNNTYNFKNFSPKKFSNNLDITHSLNTSLNYNLTNTILFSIGSIFRSGTPYTKPVEGNETLQSEGKTIINYNSPNSERLDNFFRLDASTSYTFNISNKIKSNIRIGITNLTNEKNIINSYYIITSDNKVKRINNYSLAFTPNLSFRIKF